jgi:hypothetical protein
VSRNIKVKVYKTRILLVVLYGRETWSLTWDEVEGEWKKLHSEEIHQLYSFPNIIRQIKSRRTRWAGHVTRMGEEKKLYRVLVEKSEGK